MYHLLLIFNLLGTPSLDINLSQFLTPEVQNNVSTANNVTNIRLDDEILGINSYKDVAQKLQDAKTGDVIIFHLAGYGGDVEGTMDLINNIQQSNAYVIMSVEAPVFSGHAYLAISGNELRM